VHNPIKASQLTTRGPDRPVTIRVRPGIDSSCRLLVITSSANSTTIALTAEQVTALQAELR